MSIRTLGIIIALTAAECSLFVRNFGTVPYYAIFLNSIAGPMMAILLFVPSRQESRYRHGKPRPGLTAFQIAGWSIWVVVLATFLGIPQMYPAAVWAVDPVRQLWFDSPLYQSQRGVKTPTAIKIWWLAEASLFVSLSTIFTSAMLLFATTCSWLGSRVRGTEPRSRHETE